MKRGPAEGTPMKKATSMNNDIAAFARVQAGWVKKISRSGTL